jgi:hypothetical protein
LVLACLCTAAMAWLGLYGYGWNDYEIEALPAVDALVHGHLHAFFALAPVYGGSLLERAPFALAPSLWGGGDLAIYRMMALPCLLAAIVLGLWLVARARSLGLDRLAQFVVLGLCVANPLTLAGLELGHPDELFGGVLCVAAVLLAFSSRPAWAGLALGVAFANKQWAILALGPVLLALPRRRGLCLSVAGATGLAFLAPFALFGSTAFVSGVRGAASPGSTIFQPSQVWWFFGHHGHVVRGLFGAVKPGYRTAPGWPALVSHPLIVGLALPLTLGLWLRLRGTLDQARATANKLPDVLLLLALLLLLRCILDTWDIVYYPLPFVLALAACETLGPRRVPVLALGSAVAMWAGWRWLPSFTSADFQAAFFLAWTVPLATGLALALYAPGLLTRFARKPSLPDRRELLGQAREPLGAIVAHDG